MKKFDKLLATFQGNSYPAMYEDLAEHLGVTAASIRRLALGWCPIVEFTKGKNFTGWWAIPERDEDGEPVGLGLRSQNDLKVMYPGSKHGLIYEVNPNHERGNQGDGTQGKREWVRTSDAGVTCPVCGKPDGCLVSNENPVDPAAAGCIRIRKDSVGTIGNGGLPTYLHLLKPNGDTRSNRLLEDTGVPAVIVEGFSDTTAALDLGFQATGRPSNLACIDKLANLYRGYVSPVWIIGENDKKSDGREPGKEGMIATFQAIKKVCKDVRMVMPPEHVKDLRVWKVKYGLTHAKLIEYVEKNGQEYAENIVLEDTRPLTIARAYLNSQFRMAGRYTIKRWAETWFVYRDGKYVPVKKEAFERPVYQWSYDKLAPNHEGDLKPLKADQGMVANVASAVMSETLVDSPRIPCWINDKTGPDPSDLIVFTNGILVVPKYLRGDEDYLLDPTPDLFTTSAMPFPFDPTATCHTWEAFLRSSLGDETAKIDLLREWIGYCMTMDTSHQKMMFMRGPSGAGKGTVINIIAHLMGPEQTAATSFGDLAEPFGLQPLIGKSVCLIGDARSPKSGDTMRGLERLLNVVGNDHVSVNRKNKDQLDLIRLMTRITIGSNSFLRLNDEADALLRRLLFIDFKYSFVGREDITLESRMKLEIAGIAKWALLGLRQLRERGHFTLPDSSKAALTEWRLTNNSLAAFVEECCDVDPALELRKEELFDAWIAWSGERGWKPTTATELYRRMGTVPGVTSETYQKGVHKMSVFRGLDLKDWAKRKFLGRPN